MLMKLKSTGALVEIQKVSDLWDPYVSQVHARAQRGEEQQDVELFTKGDLSFMSGESLPHCWCNPHYRDDEWQPHMAGGQEGGTSNYFGA